MHGNAFASRKNADNGLAWQRMATPCDRNGNTGVIPTDFKLRLPPRPLLPTIIIRLFLDDDIRMHFFQNPQRRQPVFTNQCKDFVNAGQAKGCQRPFQRAAAKRFAIFAEGLFDQRLANTAEFGDALRTLKPADGRLRARRLDKPFPFGFRLGILGCQDFNLVTIFKLGGQLPCLAIDAHTVAGLANLGVHRIGEIHRRGAAWQRDQISARCKTEHLVAIQVQLCMLKKLICASLFIKNTNKLLYPFD